MKKKSKHQELRSPFKREKTRGLQCLGDVSALLICDFKQKKCNTNGVSEGPEKLRCYLIELNEITRLAKRQY
jgi:hypothetical protein